MHRLTISVARVHGASGGVEWVGGNLAEQDACMHSESIRFQIAAVSPVADENGTTLRSLYYPPVNSETAKEGQVRCGEHSDYGSITLLFQGSEGLQVTRSPVFMVYGMLNSH